jgi:hypothetical protein
MAALLIAFSLVEIEKSFFLSLKTKHLFIKVTASNAFFQQHEIEVMKVKPIEFSTLGNI